MAVRRDLGATELAAANVTQHSLVDPSRIGSSEIGLPNAPRERRRQLRDGQIGNDDIATTEKRILHLVASRFGKVELRQGAGIEVDGATRDLHDRAPLFPRGAAPSVGCWPGSV